MGRIENDHIHLLSSLNLSGELATPSDFNSLDHPKEISSFIVQMIAGVFVAIVSPILGPSVTINSIGGDWWWAAIVFILLALIIRILFRKYFFMLTDAKSLAGIVYESLILLITYMIFGIIITSLWEHGTLIWSGFFESPQAFFGSNIPIIVILGMGSSSVIGIVSVSKNRLREEREGLKNVVDNDECLCHPNNIECIEKYCA